MYTGTTRSETDSQKVSTLSYTSYIPLALQTLQMIGRDMVEKHRLYGLVIAHRLGQVAVGEESVHIVVSAAHRREAWKAGEETLEAVKARAEVWKREEFVHGDAVWRSNS
jgi:molybdopterin synthase catalytic subunit